MNEQTGKLIGKGADVIGIEEIEQGTADLCTGAGDG